MRIGENGTNIFSALLKSCNICEDDVLADQRTNCVIVTRNVYVTYVA